MSKPDAPFAPASTDWPTGPGRRAAPPPATPIDSQWLLQGRKEVVILHQGQPYRLQLTRAGKLILTK